MKLKSALVLYWVINNLIQIAQTFLTKALDKKPNDEISTSKGAKEINSDKDLNKKNK